MGNTHCYYHLIQTTSLAPVIGNNAPLAAIRQRERVMHMSKENMNLAVSYSNANLVIERSLNLFYRVNQIRQSISDLQGEMQPFGVDAVDELDNYDVALRNLEKLLQKIERGAREEAIAIRYKIESK